MNKNPLSSIRIVLIILAIAVVLGAFGAHIVESKISAHYMSIYRTGNLYHFIHGLGWLIVLGLCIQLKVKDVRWINRLFFGGILLFSGSLYFLAFNEYWDMPGLRRLGAVTPLGGLSFIGAWIYSAIVLGNHQGTIES